MRVAVALLGEWFRKPDFGFLKSESTFVLGLCLAMRQGKKQANSIRTLFLTDLADEMPRWPKPQC